MIDFHQFWDSSTGFSKSFKYQILWKYDQNDPRWYKCRHMRTWRRLKMFFASMRRRSQTSYIIISNSKLNQGERMMLVLWHMWVLMPTHWWWVIWRKQSFWKALR